MTSFIQELDFDYKRFLDKSTVLFGVSGTGKSFIMVDILFQLQPFIDQIMVVSPMDHQNHTYDRGLVPPPCIHYKITTEWLEDIWERQCALSAVYSRATKPDILRKLFDKIKNNSHEREIIDLINRKLQDHREELKAEGSDDATIKSKITEMETECKKVIVIIFKHCINKNRAQLQRENLSKDEEYSLKYLNVNPKLVLIFDDCTPELDKLKKNPIINKIFFQGRWNNITILIACHTDKALSPEIKKSAFVTIFTETASARSYFERRSNDLDKESKNYAHSALKASFTPLAKWQKLAFIRDESKFYRFTSQGHSNFQFGSQVLWEYCNKVKVDGSMSINDENRFIANFD